jgi:hypothetical protein
MMHQEAKSIARHLGLTLRKVRSGDYCVKFRDGNEATAYYTDDLEDAVNAAVRMARKASAMSVMTATMLLPRRYPRSAATTCERTTRGAAVLSDGTKTI